MGEEIEGNAVALVREFRVHDASETLLRDWGEHAGAAAGKGLHPFHAPGYDALLDRIRDHEGKAGERMPAPLARVLEEHEALVRADREARKLTGRLDACLEKRDALLERAERKLDPWQPVVELGRRYGRWHREAGRAEESDASSSGTIATRTTSRRSAAGRRSSARSSASSAPPSSTTCRRGSWRRARPWTTASGRPAGTASSCRSTREPATCCPTASSPPSVRHGAASAFVKNELAMREKMSERAQLLDKTKTLLEECQQERDRAATDALPFVQQENYGAWRYKAQLAVDNAKSMLDDENKLALFFKDDPDLRQTLAAWRPLDRTMRGEREDWGRIKRERAEQKQQEQRRDRSRGLSM